MPHAAQQNPPSAPLLQPGQVYKVATIYFPDGSTKLQRDDQSILGEIAAAQRQSGSAIKVVGHSSGRVRTFDAARRHLINYQVSLDRAHAVAAALLGMGVPVGKLQVEGKGDTAPIYAEYSATGEAANRRTEVYFVN
jgi:type VI secretion system protein ImpK